nr:MAG TPA_asm: hypothetical protein [Bacteriophage sp.]
MKILHCLQSSIAFSLSLICRFYHDNPVQAPTARSTLRTRFA